MLDIISTAAPTTSLERSFKLPYPYTITLPLSSSSNGRVFNVRSIDQHNRPRDTRARHQIRDNNSSYRFKIQCLETQASRQGTGQIFIPPCIVQRVSGTTRILCSGVISGPTPVEIYSSGRGGVAMWVITVFLSTFSTPAAFGRRMSS